MTKRAPSPCWRGRTAACVGGDRASVVARPSSRLLYSDFGLTCRPAHVARMLALAHHLQDAIDRRLVPDRATVARKLGFTRARVTQLLDLLLLAPDL